MIVFSGKHNATHELRSRHRSATGIPAPNCAERMEDHAAVQPESSGPPQHTASKASQTCCGPDRAAGRFKWSMVSWFKISRLQAAGFRTRWPFA
jgi:hypothetical protein